MIFTRIQRGAERTRILLKTKAEQFAKQPVQNTVQLVRRFALHLMVLQIIALPIPSHAASGAVAALGAPDDSDPSLLVPLTSAGIAPLSITFNQTGDPEGIITPIPHSLATVEVGTSYYDAEQAQIAADAAKKAADEAAAKLKKSTSRVYAVVQAIPDTDVKQIAHDLVTAAFGEDEWPAFYALINHESGWNPAAYNTSSGACGLPQALPCSKLANGLNSSVEEQVSWTIGYIQSRYGSPSQALSFHYTYGWY